MFAVPYKRLCVGVVVATCGCASVPLPWDVGGCVSAHGNSGEVVVTIPPHKASTTPTETPAELGPGATEN